MLVLKTVLELEMKLGVVRLPVLVRVEAQKVTPVVRLIQAVKETDSRPLPIVKASEMKHSLERETVVML